MVVLSSVLLEYVLLNVHVSIWRGHEYQVGGMKLFKLNIPILIYSSSNININHIIIIYELNQYVRKQ